MRHSLFLAFGLAACATRPDAPIDASVPQAAGTKCQDVATASLDLQESTPKAVQACEPGQIAVALSQTAHWTLSNVALERDGQRFPLGDITGTDVTAGFGDAAFVLDGTAGAIHRLESETFTSLSRDPALIGGRALVRIGGSLFVGTPNGVAKVSLSDGTMAMVRSDLDVLDLAVDDIGALLVLTTNGLARMLPSGDDAPLSNATLDAQRIAFDLVTAEVVAVDTNGLVQRTAYASIVPGGPDSRPIAHGEMGPFLQSGYILAGAEYWPHRGSTPAKYPEEILWGFYPHEGEIFEGAPAVATATDVAVACAEQSYAALKAWLPTATDALTKATADGKAPRFYLWVNDYSEADDPFPAQMRQAKLWYWARDPAVAGRIPGYFKWETVVDQQGQCHWPSADQAAAFLQGSAQPHE